MLREQTPYHQKPRFTHTHAHDGITGHHALTDKATAEKKQKQGKICPLSQWNEMTL